MGRHSNPARPGQPQGKPPPALLPLPLRRTPARQLLSVLPSPLLLLLLLSFSQACSKWHNFRFCFVVEITEIINKYARPSEHQFSSPLLASYLPRLHLLLFVRNMANFWPRYAADFYAARRPVLSSFSLSVSLSHCRLHGKPEASLS